MEARLELIADHYAERRGPARSGERPVPRPIRRGCCYLDRQGLDALLARGPCFEFSPFGKPDGATGVDFGGRPGPNSGGPADGGV